MFTYDMKNLLCACLDCKLTVALILLSQIVNKLVTGNNIKCLWRALINNIRMI